MKQTASERWRQVVGEIKRRMDAKPLSYERHRFGLTRLACSRTLSARAVAGGIINFRWPKSINLLPRRRQVHYEAKSRWQIFPFVACEVSFIDPARAGKKSEWGC